MAQPPKNPPAPPKAPPAADTKKTLIDDDVLHVPRGVSRGTFIFLVGLLIFLMVIWLVPGAMLGIAGGSGNPVQARIELPSGARVEWKATDMLWQQRAIMDALALDVFLGYSLGLDPSKPAPEDLTRIVVLDRIAEDAGVVVTDEDLREHLTGILEFQRATPEDFQLGVRQRGLDQRTMEETIRRLLRVSRFQQLVGFAGAVPDPKEIEKLWHQDNEEYAFDYVALAADSLREEALEELPDDAGLEAWFAKLDEGEKEALKTEEKRTAEVALFRDTETTPATELLSAHPEVLPDGAVPATPEELATRYWNRVYHVRFRKPAEEGADAGAPPQYFSQEEVQSQCVAEAPVYFALQRWIEALAARKTAGETIDLAAEAQKLGLDHQAYLEPQPRAAFVADTALGHEELANAVFETPADGSFYPSPTPLPQGLCVVRVNSRTEPELPAFAAIRDQVVELWLAPKTQELAEKRLAALRDALERFEPAPEEEAQIPPAKQPEEHRRATAEAFQAAVQGAGLELKRRDWLNKAGPASKDPQSEDEEHRTLFAQARAFGLYDLHTDEVAEPGLSYDKKKAYLVRLAGKRAVPLENMSPVQYDRYKQTTRANAIRDIGKRMNLEYLKKNHGLWLRSAEAEEAEADGS